MSRYLSPFSCSSSPGITFLAILTINPAKGSCITTFNILNNVCAFAICLCVSPASTSVTTYSNGYLSIVINIIVPTTLNHKCIKAARLAVLLAPILERIAVTHVPIFCPNIIGNATSTPIVPVAANAKSIPIEALLLCNTTVIPNPIIIPNIGFFKLLITSINTGESLNIANESDIKSIPINNIPNPISISAISLFFLFALTNQIATPIAITKGAISVSSNATS